MKFHDCLSMQLCKIPEYILQPIAISFQVRVRPVYHVIMNAEKYVLIIKFAAK